MTKDKVPSWARDRKPISKDKLDGIYPDGGYHIVGEVAIKGSRKDAQATTRIPDGAGGMRAVLPPSSFGGMWKTVGYLPSDGFENEWVEVKQSRAPFVAGISAAAVVLLAVIIALVVLISSGIVPGPDLDPASKKYSHPQFARPDGTDPNSVLIPGYTDWEMPPNTDFLQVPLVNTEGNPVYMKFTIRLRDTDEVLYQSKLVPPGEAITEYHLNRPLPEGTYRIMILVETFSLDDPEQALNRAEVPTKIVVA